MARHIWKCRGCSTNLIWAWCECIVTLNDLEVAVHGQTFFFSLLYISFLSLSLSFVSGSKTMRSSMAGVGGNGIASVGVLSTDRSWPRGGTCRCTHWDGGNPRQGPQRQTCFRRGNDKDKKCWISLTKLKPSALTATPEAPEKSPYQHSNLLCQCIVFS